MLAEGLVLDLYPSLGPRADARSPWAGVGVRSTVFQPPLSQPASTFQLVGLCLVARLDASKLVEAQHRNIADKGVLPPALHDSHFWDALRRGRTPSLTATSSGPPCEAARRDKAFRDGRPRVARNSGPSGAREREPWVRVGVRSDQPEWCSTPSPVDSRAISRPGSSPAHIPYDAEGKSKAARERVRGWAVERG